MPELVGRSSAIERLRRAIEQLANIPANVVISGEGGTGKTLAARAISARSVVETGPFIVLDCRAGLGPSSALLDDDERGARLSRVGHHIRRAGSGTLFLKNVDSLAFSDQAMMARALDDLSDAAPDSRPFRVIASSRQNLADLCDRGLFLSDLYYNLAIATVQTVPLRFMSEDVPLLLAAFVAEFADRYQGGTPSIDAFVPGLLTRMWPGNVRELRAVATRMTLGLEEPVGSRWPRPPSLSEQVDKAEKQIIIHQLRQNRGSVSAASALLAVPKTTLYSKIQKHGIEVGAFKSVDADGAAARPANGSGAHVAHILPAEFRRGATDGNQPDYYDLHTSERWPAE